MQRDDYQLLQPIGKGNFGTVHLCIRKADKEVLVMKIIDTKNLDKIAMEAILKEVQLLTELQHPNIVRYQNSFHYDNHFHIVMENCSGGDLSQRLALTIESGGFIKEEIAIGWFYQIASALQACHSRKILHRDLKPSNILLTEDDVLKLGDFGISRSLDQTDSLATTIVGTPYSMSPELCQSQPYSFASDVWGLGCIMYEILSLRRPFEGANLLGLVWNIVQAPTPELPDRYSIELKELIEKMLSKAAQDRPSIDQLLQSQIFMHLSKPRRPSNAGLVTEAYRLLSDSVIRKPNSGGFTPVQALNLAPSISISDNILSSRENSIADERELSVAIATSLSPEVSNPKFRRNTSYSYVSGSALATPKHILSPAAPDGSSVKRGSNLSSLSEKTSPCSTPINSNRRLTQNSIVNPRSSGRMQLPAACDIVGSSANNSLGSLFTLQSNKPSINTTVISPSPVPVPRSIRRPSITSMSSAIALSKTPISNIRSGPVVETPPLNLERAVFSPPGSPVQRSFSAKQINVVRSVPSSPQTSPRGNNPNSVFNFASARFPSMNPSHGITSTPTHVNNVLENPSVRSPFKSSELPFSSHKSASSGEIVKRAQPATAPSSPTHSSRVIKSGIVKIEAKSFIAKAKLPKRDDSDDDIDEEQRKHEEFMRNIRAVHKK